LASHPSPNVARAAKQQRMRTTSATEIRAARRKRADEMIDLEPPPSSSRGMLPRLPGLQRSQVNFSGSLDKPGIYY
jgi:hypothetical protein